MYWEGGMVEIHQLSIRQFYFFFLSLMVVVMGVWLLY
jgi:hypothetical protein